MRGQGLTLIGIGISFQWRLGWFSAGADDAFDRCLMIGPIQLLFTNCRGQE
ncbi:hypothetical protein C8J27_11082 [Rhodobacter aestuarii]|uniref:Uncharacterized protein n=1 Tax=Rhodobacter aestuarii TaxID=453582 RepID=A0A1N7Q1T2_9RHOB|nr:hypothetical protein [Rhodobacter aestuarii]PTV94031.1 hypothetical protein C8J27_11082 [Rhodobacter aestuarii]SIT16785.1 hypothetical protein SAMN05421580_11282 [Rhodobacter aestuarii]